MAKLVLEIEYLSGIGFAARGPDSAAPDWPPQLDRIFSALVATWGARGEQKSEAAALRWLEELPVPTLVASASEARTAPIAFVPPNDPKTGRLGDQSVLPPYRRRQPRRFPASRPGDPVVRYYWGAADLDGATFEALQRLATDTAYVGHSSSLTRCRFLQWEDSSAHPNRLPSRRVYPGRFDELRRDYERFVRSNGKIGRPRPGTPVISQQVQALGVRQSCFSDGWLVLEHIDGDVPDIRAAALVAKELRDTLLSGYSQCGIGDKIPAEVSGHTEDGRPSPNPHLAIVPFVFAGFPYADGHLLGFALVPPRGYAILKDPNFRRAMRRIAPFDEGAARSSLRLRSFDLHLSPTVIPTRISLDPTRYTRSSCLWATITPIVLDRHLKKAGVERQGEVEDQIQAACRNIGLPEPEKVYPDKHPAVEGVPSAYPSGNAPAWMRWRMPVSLANRQLTHAMIRFSAPVAGPVLLGAGRFVGLGLCLPLDDAETEA